MRVKVCAQTTMMICISSVQQSQQTEKLYPEGAVSEKDDVH